MPGSVHPLEPLSADEVEKAVALLKKNGKVTPTTRFVSGPELRGKGGPFAGRKAKEAGTSEAPPGETSYRHQQRLVRLRGVRPR